MSEISITSSKRLEEDFCVDHCTIVSWSSLWQSFELARAKAS